MRDLNKIKEFSARDYNARPTLLAEADSRKLAKKNMPGLGGTTCHSFQPVVAPPSPPPQSQHGQRASRRGGREYPEYQGHSHDRHRSDTAYRRQSSRHNHDDAASLSSSRSSRGQRAHRQHRSRYPDNNRYDQSGSAYNSDYEDYPSGREFRRVDSPSRSRRSSNRDSRRGRRGHANDHHYDYYDCDEFSDEYYSDEYDDLNRREAGGRHGSPSNSAKGLRRRAAQRRTYGDSHTGKDNDFGRSDRSWKQTSRNDRKGNGHRDARRRPVAPVYLDDPRNNSDILPPSGHRAARDSISDDSDSADIPRNSKPRSQFGRFLENIKRNAIVSETSSGTALPVQNNDEAPTHDINQSDLPEGDNSKPLDNKHVDDETYTENDVAETNVSPVAEAVATPTAATVTAS
ncbi:hypothetical protein LPJ73_001266 [Coemansia sp. RSA 2703]|nr:hypothetical protein LPJ73_001266 [Coemansia sp. RSA 2703]